MIMIDMEMPESCFKCRMGDSEYAFCHGHEIDYSNKKSFWEFWDEKEFDYRTERPKWCPLIEAKNYEAKKNN